MIEAKKNLHPCTICGNLTTEKICSICDNEYRNNKLICVVEDYKSIFAFEKMGKYNGVYHVLGGVISPMEGIGPKDIEIDSLIERVTKGGIDEIILALPTTMEGDTTNFYIYRRLQNAGIDIKITQIARGVAVGNQLEYTDEITLGRSIVNRTNFNG